MLLSDEHRAVQEAVRNFVQEQIAPHAARWDRESHFPAVELKGLAASMPNQAILINTLALQEARGAEHAVARRKEAQARVQAFGGGGTGGGDDRDGVTGEVWSVTPEALTHIDSLEGLDEGMYRREPVPLLAPFANLSVEGYLYARSIKGRIDLGSTWRE